MRQAFLLLKAEENVVGSLAEKVLCRGGCDFPGLWSERLWLFLTMQTGLKTEHTPDRWAGAHPVHHGYRADADASDRGR